MTIEQFMSTLRQYRWKDPFQPFVIELEDETLIVLDPERMAFGGGAGGYAAPDKLYLFDHHEVRDIRPVSVGGNK